MSDNELSSVTKNQSPDTSLVVDNNHNKLEPGEQVTQKATLNNPVENNKKRRNRKASFLSPPQSKVINTMYIYIYIYLIFTKMKNGFLFCEMGCA